MATGQDNGQSRASQALEDGMAQQLARTEQQIDTLARTWGHIYTHEQARFAANPQEDGRSYQERIATFRAAIVDMRHERDERALFHDPAYRAYEAERRAQEHPAPTRASEGRGIDR